MTYGELYGKSNADLVTAYKSACFAFIHGKTGAPHAVEILETELLRRLAMLEEDSNHD